jgi:hypothetical protein
MGIKLLLAKGGGSAIVPAGVSAEAVAVDLWRIYRQGFLRGDLVAVGHG